MVEFSSSVCSDDRFLVDIEGHAEYAPRGSDIVCAAASILALDLADIAKKAEREGKTKSLYVETGDGRVSIDADFKRAYAGEFAAALRTVENGFALLESAFPEHVICT